MYIVFDIGATKTRIATSKDGITVSEPLIISTEANFDYAIASIRDKAQELAEGEHITHIAGGVPGPLDKERTKVMNAPNLPEWNRKPLKAELEKVLGAPVFLENDAALTGLGEALVGAGKGYSIVAYITVSTGVGGARIVDGVIDKNAWGFEPGHQIIFSSDAGGADLEWYISGSAIEKRFGKKPYEITDESVWEELARQLSTGLNNTIVHWSPDIVVIGGSMMKQPGISIERVCYHLKNVLKIFPEYPIIEKAALGDSGGLYGALAFLNQHIKK